MGIVLSEQPQIFDVLNGDGTLMAPSDSYEFLEQVLLDSGHDK